MKKKMNLSNIAIISVLIISSATLTISLIPEEEIQLTHCGAGQYMDTDSKTCIVKSSIQPETKIVEKVVTETVIETETITVPSKVIRGINAEQNVFIVDNGINPTVFLQDCNGVTILNNPIMTSDGENGFTLRDSVVGMTVFVDHTSTYQYQITTVPSSGQSFNIVGTELMRSDKYDLICDEVEPEETPKTTTQEDEFYYDVELISNDSVLIVEGDVGKIIDNDRDITGMIVLYEDDSIKMHMESFNIDLDSDGEFYETVDVSGTSNTGKTWEDNEDYRVLISYDGEQITKNFEK